MAIINAFIIIFSCIYAFMVILFKNTTKILAWAKGLCHAESNLMDYVPSAKYHATQDPDYHPEIHLFKNRQIVGFLIFSATVL
jgi:hypothetical protein